MRNKEEFIARARDVMTEGVLTDEQLIEDAAHTMVNTDNTKYEVPKNFTTTNKDEVFLFEKNLREATDDGPGVEDYFYIGRGE